MSCQDVKKLIEAYNLWLLRTGGPTSSIIPLVGIDKPPCCKLPSLSVITQWNDVAPVVVKPSGRVNSVMAVPFACKSNFSITLSTPRLDKELLSP